MNEPFPPPASPSGDGNPVQQSATGNGNGNQGAGKAVGAGKTGAAGTTDAANTTDAASTTGAANTTGAAGTTGATTDDTPMNNAPVNGATINGAASNGAGNNRFRIRLGLILTILGFLIFLMGVDPGIFGLDRSPVTGFVQIATFLVGLALMCMGGYTGLNALWNGTEKSIAADIGLRLVATGYVVAVACGMADIFGVGSQPLPQIPYFGPWQAIGVMVGEAIIALGFILLIPYRMPRRL